MDLHYSQTLFRQLPTTIMFHYLMDLHYSQTTLPPFAMLNQFHYLMDLHYSQTRVTELQLCITFHYLMDLHYSQTRRVKYVCRTRFTTLWIYTILKRVIYLIDELHCFTTLWIYTILKQLSKTRCKPYRFTTLWIYTILKPPCTSVPPNRPFHYLMDLHYSQTSNKLRPLYSAGQIHKI